MNIQEESEKIIKSPHSNEQKIKEIVTLISNIPYKRIGSLNPVDMLEKGMGSCTPKHIFLAQCLERLNIPVKFLIIPFYYKNLNITYPSGYEKVIASMPISYHIALKAKLKDIWTIIDVTWDPKLKGFSSNKNWDGVSDMELAVTPEDIIEQETDPRAFEKDTGAKYTDEEKERRIEFYRFFDTILENSRI